MVFLNSNGVLCRTASNVTYVYMYGTVYVCILPQ